MLSMASVLFVEQSTLNIICLAIDAIDIKSNHLNHFRYSSSDTMTPKHFVGLLFDDQLHHDLYHITCAIVFAIKCWEDNARTPTFFFFWNKERWRVLCALSCLPVNVYFMGLKRARNTEISDYSDTSFHVKLLLKYWSQSWKKPRTFPYLPSAYGEYAHAIWINFKKVALEVEGKPYKPRKMKTNKENDIRLPDAGSDPPMQPEIMVWDLSPVWRPRTSPFVCERAFRKYKPQVEKI